MKKWLVIFSSVLVAIICASIGLFFVNAQIVKIHRWEQRASELMAHLIAPVDNVVEGSTVIAAAKNHLSHAPSFAHNADFPTAISNAEVRFQYAWKAEAEKFIQTATLRIANYKRAVHKNAALQISTDIVVSSVYGRSLLECAPAGVITGELASMVDECKAQGTNGQWMKLPE